jgi:hypothetical protein
MVLDSLIKELKGKSNFELLNRQIELYETVPFKDFNKPDEDMLLFQFGCYDFGDGEFFNIDLTRQLSGDADSAMEHLSCSLYFTPNQELRALGSSNFWCFSRTDIKDFWLKVSNHESLKLCKNLKVIKSTIRAEYV